MFVWVGIGDIYLLEFLGIKERILIKIDVFRSINKISLYKLINKYYIK